MFSKSCGLYAMDADESVYNERFKRVFKILLNEFYDEIKTYGFKASFGLLAEEDKEKVATLRQRILHGLPQVIANITDKLAINESYQGNYAQSIKQVAYVYKAAIPTLDKKTRFSYAKGFVNSDAINWIWQLFPDVYKLILLETNANLIKFICEKIENHFETHAIFCSASNRSDFSRDFDCKERKGTGVFAVDLKIITDEVQRRLPTVRCIYEPILGGDIEGELKPGTSAAQISDAFLNGIKASAGLKPASATIDETKLINAYMLGHYVRQVVMPRWGLEEEVPLQAHFFDDQHTLLNDLTDKIIENRYFLPRLEFHTYYYTGRKPELVGNYMCYGETDKNFAQNLRDIIAYCAKSYQGKEKDNKTINCAADLPINEFLKARAARTRFKKPNITEAKPSEGSLDDQPKKRQPLKRRGLFSDATIPKMEQEKDNATSLQEKVVSNNSIRMGMNKKD